MPTRSPLYRLVYLAIALSLLASVAAPAVAAPAAAQSAPPDPRFGAVESYMASDLASSVNVGWDRLAFHWYTRQPHGPDEWVIPPEETEAVNTAQAAGRETVGLLMGTATWATEGGSVGGVPSGLYLPVNDPANLWAVFVRRMVGEYKGQIRHWIIWNEPDIALGDPGVQFEGTVEDYYQLLKVAYVVAKQANPQAVIHLAGLTYWHDVVYQRTPYLQRLLDVAKKDPTAASHNYYFDVISLHIYFKTETVPMIVSFYQQILKTYKLRKSIWLNETNAAPDDDPAQPANPLVAVTQNEQASFIIQSTALALGLGVERIAIYKLIDDHLGPGSEPYGLFRMDGSARPAAAAFGAVTTYFSGTRSATLLTQPTYYLVTLRRSQGITRIIWARGGQAFTVPLAALIGGKAFVVDRFGKATPITRDKKGFYQMALSPTECSDPNGCAVGGAPLILVENWR
jgi:Glycosyl hydrolase catalytic core